MNDHSICKGVRIAGISASVPAKKEDNLHLPIEDETAKTELIRKLGIRYRRVADSKVCASDLCVKAAESLLKEMNCAPDEFGILVFVSQTPDHLIPGSAASIIKRLGFQPNCMYLDVNQGCSGYVNGLQTIAGLMSTYRIKKGLLLVGDTITRTISKSDMSLVPVFSDAGSATVLELTDGDVEMKFNQGTIGSDFRSIYIPHGGGREKLTEESFEIAEGGDYPGRSPSKLSMDGKDVFAFGLTTIPKAIKALLESSEIDLSVVDHLVLHQANQLLSNLIAKKVGIDADRVPSSLFNYGNTSCATIPVTLVSQLRDKLTSTNNRMLLSGFGVGLSWANVILDIDNVTCPEMIEL